MTEQLKRTDTDLTRWEQGALLALGLSNGINLFLWFTISMMSVAIGGIHITLPLYVNQWLPHAIVIGGFAAAGALDGVLVATLAGVREGRKGNWTWATLASAVAFSALISYALHANKLADWPWLHCAMIAVMLPYNFHLSQPRKSLHSVETPKSMEDNVVDQGDEALGQGKCKKCGKSHPRLVDYRFCKGSIDDHWTESQTGDGSKSLVSTSIYASEPRRTNGVNHS